MLIDIQMPKRDSKIRRFTIAPCLTDEEIAERDPKWFTPESIRYYDEFLVENEDDIAILDPSFDYRTVDADDAIREYLPLIEKRDDRDPHQYEIALAVLSLILSNRIPVQADTEKIRQLLNAASADFWGKK